MDAPRLSLPEVRSHGQDITPSLYVSSLSVASSVTSRRFPQGYQSAACHTGRAWTPTGGRLHGPRTRPWSYQRPGSNYRPEPRYHSPRDARERSTAAYLGWSSSQTRRRAQACRKKRGAILAALDDLLRDAVAGDPITGLKWTHKSTRRLSAALRRRGFRASPNTVARLLRDHGFCLRCCRKQLAETGHRDRDRQFRYLIRLRHLYVTRHWPVISVDSKKKEWVGPFKNPGRCWRKRPRKVFAHDFPSWATGQAIPYGIYDLVHNDGFVVVGISHDTPTFAVASIRRWWLAVGRYRYPKERRLLIEADSGGSNDHRKWEWKVALQRFADEFGLTIVVTHFPSGASKWNPIDHRMFSLISANWAGEPLLSYEVVLKYIRTTRSAQSFHCRACMDRREYEPCHRVEPQDKASVRLKRRNVSPQWNYMIMPHTHRMN
jgi:hypothetical protein